MGVKIKYKTKVDVTKAILKNMPSVKRSIEVGCINGEHTWLAGIHEYGCDITPKNGKYLTVPISPKSLGKKATDFPDMFVVQASSGEKFLAISEDGNEDEIELLFWLARSVKIPERSFLRSGHDKYINEVMNKAEKLIGQFLEGKMTKDQYFDTIGQMLSTNIKKYARNVTSPPNASVTAENKGSSNPLVDTGNMIEGISWRVK